MYMLFILNASMKDRSQHRICPGVELVIGTLFATNRLYARRATPTFALVH